MKFRIGEKVKFLNDTNKGIITGFVNEKTVLVKIEEGFEVPVFKDEIILTKIENNVSDKKEMEEMYLTREVKNKDIPVRKPKPEKKNDDISEIDLHIGEILDNYRGMSNGEILQVQLDRFTTALEGAINNNQKRIVFIHGLGNGKLKFEVRKLLDTKYSHLKYQDASFKEYGYGATMVILK